MMPDTLKEDMEHRRALAGELARYADGSQGLGLGTALAGGFAILGPILMDLLANWMIARINSLPSQLSQHTFGPLLLLCFPAIALINAFAWLLLKGPLQRRLYRRFGEAHSALPRWELRLGLVLLALLAFAGIWICKGSWMALRVPAGSELSPLNLWGAPMLKLAAAVGLLGTILLTIIAWRKVRGWRNWLGWTALCAPFLLFVSAPLFDDRHPSILAIVGLLSIMAAFLYLPFMAIYVGARDHMFYRRLVKKLSALPDVEVGQ